MIKAIIFDFFGVLVGDGFFDTYKLAGGDPVKDNAFIQDLLDRANRGTITSDEFRKMLCEKIGITVEDYVQSLKKSEFVNYELLDYIKTLKQKYKTAILSNVNSGGLERRIPRKTLDEHFDVTIASGDVGYIKPEPEIYKLVADNLRVKPEECVYTDDSKAYVKGAEEVGMRAIDYQSFDQYKKDLEKILAAASDN